MSNPLSRFDGKKILVTGGTGSFGGVVARRLLAENASEVRVFSRDEKKQEDMRVFFGDERLKFYIGDVRDKDSVLTACKHVDYVFHAAALKQVPSCEFFPMEAVKTNVEGTANVLSAAISESVSRVIVLSTDKAVYPINAMGISKAMMEKVAISMSRQSESTVINVTRYGNVMCWRGSVIPLFANQIASGKNLSVTDPSMTRFMMTLDDAVDLVFFAFENGLQGETFVQKAPAASLATLVAALKEVLEAPDHGVDIIGTRHGEKLFEVLLSREEMLRAKDLGGFFAVEPDLRDLNYQKFTQVGSTALSDGLEYNSHNTHQLTVPETAHLLRTLDEFK